jgi:hypothetical protein
MPDIFEEVDEALRRERMARVWERHKGLILLALAGIVLGAGVYSGLKSWTIARAEKTTDAFLAARRGDDKGTALEAFAREHPSDAGALALLTAAAQTQSADPEKAEGIYRTLADDAHAAKLLRDRARILEARAFAARTQNSAAKDQSADTTTKARDLLEKMDALLAEKTNVWTPQARLAAAILAGWSLNDPARARTYLGPLAASDAADTPPSLQRLAAQMDHVLALRTPSAKPDEKAAISDAPQTAPAAGVAAQEPTP